MILFDSIAAGGCPDVRDTPFENDFGRGVFRIFTSKYVFLNRDNKPTQQQVYNRSLTALAKQLHLPHISMHCLRHTFATRCIEAGMKPKVLQEILGHADITMTMNLYVHVTEDEKVSEMMKLMAYM